MARKDYINTFILSSPSLIVKTIYNLYLDGNLLITSGIGTEHGPYQLGEVKE